MEVAAAENEGQKWPAALPRRAVVTMSALSVLFAWLAARFLRRPSATNEEVALSFSAVVWQLSPLICSYLFFWTVALSGKRGALAMSMRVSFMLLLAAAAAAKLVGPNAGAAVMFLATVFSATASGRALADRRQRAGIERSADAVALCTPSYRSRAEHEYERGLVHFFVFAAVFLVGMLSLVVLLDAWLAPQPGTTPPGEVNLGVLVFFTGPGLLVTRMFLLHGRPSDPAVPVACWMAIVAGVVGWIVIAILLGVFFGEVAATVFFWVVGMGLAALLGYGQGMRWRYEQLMAIKRSQPRMAQDASGLLIGRDKEDVCHAQI
ncbi:hypothetical protein EJB05_28687, partial [Eragrostis curvula]